MASIIGHTLQSVTFLEQLLILLVYSLAWGYCLTIKGWVSDDIAGIAQFSDRLSNGDKIDNYEVEYGGKKIKVKNTGWNPAIEFPGCFLRWFRLNLGKKFSKLGENKKGHAVYGWVQDARRHHAINLLVNFANILLGYNLLSHLFGHKLAFLSMLLFAVHPCAVQTVGWISGINYLFSLFGALLTFNIALYVHNPYIIIPVIAFTSAVSCMTLLPGCFNWIILLLMGQWNAAIVALIVGVLIAMRQGIQVMSFRTKAFKEQHMEKSTTLYGRKIIIMVKTFWYYCKLIPFPKRLGLFHTWGYHFEEPLEHIDHEFWLGLFCMILYGLATCLSPWPVQFGLIWMFVYLLTFSNFMTAQQFVSERYAFISTFGFSIVLGYLLQNNPIIIAFLVGVAMMRIWVHLPTFQNEVRFYESNWFNFPGSEVAMGNLGVAYLNHGMPNKALDTWQEASRQNKFYDVPWYNLYSLCRQNGDIQGARRFLAMCLEAKIVHFPEQWKHELKELEDGISKMISVQDFTQIINKAIKEANYERS